MTRDEILNQLNTIILWADECAEMEIDGDLLKGIVAARDLLDIPQPDAETGLVPCGCGGKPEYITSYDEEAWKNVVKVWCKKCKIHIIFKAPWDARGFDAMKEDAKKAWNRAMGYTDIL